MAEYVWVKGEGVQPAAKHRATEAAKKLADTRVQTQSSGGHPINPPTPVICTVEGCGRMFKKAAPMGANHFKAKHADLMTTTDAWRQYLKPAPQD